MKNISDKTLAKVIEESRISNCQSDLLKQVISATKIKNSKIFDIQKIGC